MTDKSPGQSTEGAQFAAATTDISHTVEDEAFVLSIDGYEGPLELLLDMARQQKVDLSHISILALAEQYIAYIHHLRELNLSLAAEYLVMAAWLAYLKSRLLLPQEERQEDDISAEDLATLLQLRLKRLDILRQNVAKLFERPRLGVDFFVNGAAYPLPKQTKTCYTASLYDLLGAYASTFRRNNPEPVTFLRRKVWTPEEAKAFLQTILETVNDWVPFSQLVLRHIPPQRGRRSGLASSFGAVLAMAKEGHIQLRSSANEQDILVMSVNLPQVTGN